MMAKPKAHILRTSSQTTLAAGLLGKEVVNINSGLGATTAGELHLLYSTDSPAESFSF